MAENEGIEKKAVLSFGFAKKIESKKLEKSIASESVHTKEETDFVFTLEGKEIRSSKPKELGPKEFVIPLIKENNWRTPYLDKVDKLENGEVRKHITTKQTQESHSDDLSEQAVKEIIEQAAIQNENWQSQGKPDTTLEVPLLVRNQVPEGFENEDKLDVSLRPNGPEDADYEQIPIDQFGFAMLRGMGWKDGEGIGKNKELVPPLEAVLRPKGLGLGADKSRLMQDKNGTISNGLEDNKEGLVIKKSAFCLIVQGKQKDLYGVIEGMDEDNARVMVKLTLSGKIVTVSQYFIEVVSKNNYDKSSKYLNKGKVDKYNEEEKKKQEERRSRSRERSVSPHRKERKYASQHYHDSTSRSNRESTSPNKPSIKEYDDMDTGRKRKHDKCYKDNMPSSDRHTHETKKSSAEDDSNKFLKNVKSNIWVRPDIRVRIVDKKFKNGKYYKSKVVVVDVVSRDNCICQTDEGKVLEGLQQSLLETVIPKSDHSHALIVTGKHKGQIGEVIKRSKEKCEALIQLLSDRDTVLKLGYDDICEYVGNVEHEFDY